MDYVEAAGKTLDEAIADALEQLGNFDIGLGASLNLSTQNHQACQRIWPTLLHNGNFVPFKWDKILTLVPGEN